MRRLAVLLVVIAGCERGPAKEATPTPAPKTQAPEVTPPAPVTPPPKQATRIELTAVTLADDCGGTAPWTAPAKIEKADEDPPAKSATKAKAKSDSAYVGAGARARMRCEQTSMQLAIIAGDASKIQVTSVELFSENGVSLGTLTASNPTRWSEASSTYEAWDEAVTVGSSTNVSYVLSQPKWDQIGDRWNKTFTLKAVFSVGGVSQTAQRTVTVTAPTALPPNVKT